MVDMTVPVDDAEMFRSAISDEQPKAEPEARQEEAKAESTEQERARDEQGRFAPKTEKPAEQQAQEPAKPEGQQQADPDQSAQVPSWRLREISEERNRVAKELAEERQARQRFEAEVRELHARQQQAQQKPPPDMLAEPEAWQQHLVTQQQASLDQLRFGISEDWARDKYGDEKVEAVKKWVDAEVRDPATRHKIYTARSPYREMIKLHDERQTLSQIGGDLGAYKAKVLEEALNDPAHLQRVADKLRGEQGQPSTNGQRPVVQLPPSLSRAPGANVPRDGTAGDLSDASLIAHAFAPGRR